MSKAHARGMKTRRQVLGDEWVDSAIANTTVFNAEFQDLITRYAWDEIWNRPHLPRKVRRIMVIAQMVALGHWEEFELHIRAALQSGDLDADDIKEVPLQSAVYCGVPAANHAFKSSREVMAQLSANESKTRKPRKASTRKKQ